jgi:hypothetical protein
LICRSTILFCALAAAHAAPIVIYNGALNTVPNAQGWAYANAGTASNTAGGGAAILDTFGQVSRAGYGISSPIALDRNGGYRITFDLQLDAETHTNASRSGLSFIVIGNDLQGIEISLWTNGPPSTWTNEVWAQNVGFTHGEGAAFDTTQRTVYTLLVGGSSYTLLAGGIPLISGALRTYSGAPYNVPNFIFVGDDTFEGSATTRFFAATVDTPEPATLLLGAFGIVGLLVRRYRAISPVR